MLSFTKGNNIAIIRGGKYDNKYIKIFDPDLIDNNKKEKENIKEPKLEKLGKYELMELKEAIEKNDSSLLVGKVLKNYNKIVNNHDHIGKEFKITDGEIIPVVTSNNQNENQRSCIYISGKSGKGKSVLAHRILEDYIERPEFKKNKVYIFSSKNEDIFDTINSKRILRIDLDDIVEEEPIKLNEESGEFLHNSLCIFDDYEYMSPDKSVQKKLVHLLNEMLENGRSKNINMIVISHLLCNQNVTKLLIAESTSTTIFPGAKRNHIKYYMDHYMGLTKENIEKLFHLKSRYVTVMEDPTCVIAQREIYVIN